MARAIQHQLSCVCLFRVPRCTHFGEVNIGTEKSRGLVGFLVAVFGIVVTVVSVVAIVTVMPVPVAVVQPLVALVGHRSRVTRRAGDVVDERGKTAVERPRTKGGKAASDAPM